MDEKEELLAALQQSDDALIELMACSTELLNSRVAKGLYKQCHEATMNASRLLQARRNDEFRRQARNQPLTRQQNGWCQNGWKI